MASIMRNVVRNIPHTAVPLSLFFFFTFYVLQDAKAAAARTMLFHLVFPVFLSLQYYLPNSFIYFFARSSLSRSNCIDCAFITETVESIDRANRIGAVAVRAKRSQTEMNNFSILKSGSIFSK